MSKGRRAAGIDRAACGSTSAGAPARAAPGAGVVATRSPDRAGVDACRATRSRAAARVAPASHGPCRSRRSGRRSGPAVVAAGSRASGAPTFTGRLAARAAAARAAASGADRSGARRARHAAPSDIGNSARTASMSFDVSNLGDATRQHAREGQDGGKGKTARWGFAHRLLARGSRGPNPPFANWHPGDGVVRRSAPCLAVTTASGRLTCRPDNLRSSQRCLRWPRARHVPIHRGAQSRHDGCSRSAW